MKTLHVDLRVGESVVIDGTTVTLGDKSGQRVRLSIKAEPSVKVDVPSRTKTGAPQARLGVIGPS